VHREQAAATHQTAESATEPKSPALPPPPPHGPGHAADDHQRRRVQRARSLVNLSSTTKAARTRVHREQAAATHQTAGSATEPKNPALPPPPRHGPDHAADDHQRRRFQLPRPLFDPRSPIDAARTRVDREQAAAAHQTAGSATEPKNPALPPPPPHGPDHAADDHQRHRFQLPRSLFDPSSTTEAQRAQIDRGGAATAHQATESTTKPPNPPLLPRPPPRPRSRRR